MRPAGTCPAQGSWIARGDRARSRWLGCSECLEHIRPFSDVSLRHTSFLFLSWRSKTSQYPPFSPSTWCIFQKRCKTGMRLGFTEPRAAETGKRLASLRHTRAGGVPERCGASCLPYINIVSIDIIVLANCSILRRERELQGYGFIIHNTVCAYCWGKIQAA